ARRICHDWIALRRARSCIGVHARLCCASRGRFGRRGRARRAGLRRHRGGARPQRRGSRDRQAPRSGEASRLHWRTRGMKVLDMGAGGGYSTELMVRAVGASGVVYAQNAADLGARAKERFDARMKSPAMTKVVALTRPFDDPLPAEVRDLDLITFFFFYH